MDKFELKCLAEMSATNGMKDVNDTCDLADRIRPLDPKLATKLDRLADANLAIVKYCQEVTRG